MLIEIYLSLFFITFIFTILSFIPIGERGREGEFETRNFVILFPWVAMGLFFMLGILSLDVTVLKCDTIINSINTSVANFSNYTNSWSCYEYPYFNSGMAWFCNVLGVIMFAYAVIATLLWAVGGVARGISRVGKEKRNV